MNERPDAVDQFLADHGVDVADHAADSQTDLNNEDKHSLLGGGVTGTKVSQEKFISDITGSVSSDSPAFIGTLDGKSKKWVDKAYVSDETILQAINNAVKKKLNVYILTGTASNTKTRSEIAFKTGLYLDFDVYNPASDKAIKDTEYASKDAALAELLSMCDNKGYFNPTYILDSGNGLQIHWLLDEPVSNEVWQRLADAFKSKLILDDIKFDTVVPSDATRYMRVPSTTNYKPVGKDIVENPTDVIRYGEKYSLDQLTEMVGGRAVGEVPADIDTILNDAVGRNGLGVSDNRHVSVSQVDYCHKFIDMSNRDRGRWVQVINATINGLRRGDMPDDGIVEYIIERCKVNLDGSPCDAYAGESDDKQIVGMVRDYDNYRSSATQFASLIYLAKEYCESQGGVWDMADTDIATAAVEKAKSIEEELLQEFNETHAYVMFGGAGVVIYPESPRGGVKWKFGRISAVRMLYASKRIPVEGSKPTSLFNTWLGWSGRRSYKGVEFLAVARLVARDNHKLVGGDGEPFNVYRGLAVTPKKGKHDLINWHLKNIICSGNDELYLYVLSWFARMMQCPQDLAETCLVMKSIEGTGKNTFLDMFSDAFGEHAFAATDREQVTGRFNGMVSKSVFLVANEALFGGDKKGIGKLKSLVTDMQQAMELKGFETQMVRSCLHIVMSTNSNWAVNISKSDRRFVVMDVSDSKKGDMEYFTALHKQIANGGLEAYMYHLLYEVDISEFKHRVLPNGQGVSRGEHVVASAGTVEQWWHYCLQEGSDACFGMYGSPNQAAGDWDSGAIEVDNEIIKREYLDWFHKYGHSKYGKPSTYVIREIKGLLVDKFSSINGAQQRKSMTKNSNGKRSLILPDLAQCRQLFTENMGAYFEWDD